MAKPIHRSRRKAKTWKPADVVLALTAGTITLAVLCHLITHIATA